MHGVWVLPCPAGLPSTPAGGSGLGHLAPCPGSFRTAPPGPTGSGLIPLPVCGPSTSGAGHKYVFSCVSADRAHTAQSTPTGQGPLPASLTIPGGGLLSLLPGTLAAPASRPGPVGAVGAVWGLGAESQGRCWGRGFRSQAVRPGRWRPAPWLPPRPGLRPSRPRFSPRGGHTGPSV